jgi:hypothetical protein
MAEPLLFSHELNNHQRKFIKMKPTSLTLLVAISFLLINCGNNQAATNETQSANN